MTLSSETWEKVGVPGTTINQLVAELIITGQLMMVEKQYKLGLKKSFPTISTISKRNVHISDFLC